jgi:aminocarboxymuconate-semialdehyde decarboxylase
MLGHLGGTIPYVAERIDRGYEAFSELRTLVPEKPSFYFKRNCWYDTVNFEPGALRCAIEFAGADHVVLGTDYPHQIGDMEKAVRVVSGLPIPADDRAAILGGNAARLLKLDRVAALQR